MWPETRFTECQTHVPQTLKNKSTSVNSYDRKTWLRIFNLIELSGSQKEFNAQLPIAASFLEKGFDDQNAAYTL